MIVKVRKLSYKELEQSYKNALNTIDRLNNIINELEKYIDDNYFYDDVGMKIFDVSLLEDKLKELKKEMK